jgi:hypothetical protein
MDKKQLRKDMLNGGSIEDAKSRMFDRTRNLEQTDEVRKNFKDQLDIQRDMRDSAAESAGSIARIREEVDPEFKKANLERDWQEALEQKEQAEKQAALDAASKAEAARAAEEERIKNSQGLRGLANQIKNDATGAKDKAAGDINNAKNSISQKALDNLNNRKNGRQGKKNKE